MNDAAPVLLRRIDMRGASLSPSHLRAALPRGGTDVDAVLPRVRPVVEAVRDRGAEAALDFCAEFDGVRPGTVRVPAAELDRALADLDPAVRDALEVAILRARAVHADQRRQDTVTTVADGATVTVALLTGATVTLRLVGPAVDIAVGEPVAYHPVAELLSASAVLTTARAA